MGYGKRAMQQLVDYYTGQIPCLNDTEESAPKVPDHDLDTSLLEESIKPRKNLPPLLLKLNERPAEKLDYLGVSYGLTSQLLK